MVCFPGSERMMNDRCTERQPPRQCCQQLKYYCWMLMHPFIIATHPVYGQLSLYSVHHEFCFHHIVSALRSISIYTIDRHFRYEFSSTKAFYRRLRNMLSFTTITCSILNYLCMKQLITYMVAFELHQQD